MDYVLLYIGSLLLKLLKFRRSIRDPVYAMQAYSYAILILYNGQRIAVRTYDPILPVHKNSCKLANQQNKSNKKKEEDVRSATL